MRIVLFTGKGGVGKTTTAAACAVTAARAGVRTLIMSTDAAHSLGDALDRDLRASGPPGDPVRVEENLHALQVSASDTVDRSWRVVQDYLLELLATGGVDPVVAEEVTSLPGAEEVAVLAELLRRAESGGFDLLVVDCAPTAETLRLLALPEAIAWHLERLLSAQRGLLRTLRPAAGTAMGLPLPGPQVATTVTGWYRQMRAVHALLTGDQTSVRLVLTPERVVIAEARRTWTSLSLYGFAVDAVLVNKVIPDETGDAWRQAWNAAQLAGLALVRESFHGMPVVQAGYLAQEPVGTDALAGLADQMVPVVGGERGAVDGDAYRGGPLHLLDPVRHRGPAVRRSGNGYVLSLPLPLVSAREVDLKRRDTELLVVVGDHRRVLSLPAVLQRCVVKGARVTDGTLQVSFEPDPALWPADAASSAQEGASSPRRGGAQGEAPEESAAAENGALVRNGRSVLRSRRG